MMKVVQFAVPASNDSIIIEEDVLPYSYNYFHRHDEMQITMIVKGEGTLIIDNYTQRFSAGEIYIISANQPHIFRSDESYFDDMKDGSAQAIHLYFDAKTIFSNLINLPELEQIKNFVENINYGLQIPRENEAVVGLKLRKVANTTGLPRLLNFMKLLHYLSLGLNDYTSLSSGSNSKTIPVAESNRINKIYQYTLAHYTEDISLDMVANFCHMTPQAFCKYFKKHTSKTYITFLQEIRINAACVKIIKGDDEGISAVAYATGFNSAINFNKVFKKITGIAPREYLKKFRVNRTELYNAV